MVDFKIVSRIIGQLLFLEAAFMVACLVMSFVYRENDGIAFMISILLTTCGGIMFRMLGREAGNNLNRRDAFLVVTAAWVIFSFFGMFPFLFSGYITNFTDAYFETMSGFTTTGATIFDDVEQLPHGLLFWRSLTQWIGGLGIVFFTIAILPSMVGGSMKVFAAEATGPIKSKMHPRLSTSAKWLWSIYLALTVACGVSYWLAGMGWFDSLNYSMTTTATGGFSPHNDSTLHFHSAAIDYISILFQFLACMNFILLYSIVFKLQFKNLRQNSEFKLYTGTIGLATLWIMLMLIFNCGYDIEQAFRSALYQVVSFITTTGLFNDDAARWPHITWVILGACMFIGSCAGSTSGGFKCIRGVMIVKVIQNEFKRILHPNAVLPVKVNGQSIPQSKIYTLLSFFAVFVIMCLFASTVMIALGIDHVNAITISLSCVSNVGPTLGTEIGPVMSWSELPSIAKWLCSLLMLMGRLEIMTVLVLFSKSFWKEN
jgi:trk system potassium uptake protein TrkH